MLNLNTDQRLSDISSKKPFLTCNRHLILSPGAIITVVNTPDNIPATNNCGKLDWMNMLMNFKSNQVHTYIDHLHLRVSAIFYQFHIQKNRRQTLELPLACQSIHLIFLQSITYQQGVHSCLCIIQ